jgi:hypothetical protein
MKEWVGLFILWGGPALLLVFLWVREFVIHRDEPHNPNNGFSPRVSMTLWILISIFLWPVSAFYYFLVAVRL